MNHRVVVARSAARRLAESLPEPVAAACIEFVFGPLAEDPAECAPLHKPFEGQWRARRGEYRVRYRIDGETRTVYVLDIDHRRDTYRSRIGDCAVPAHIEKKAPTARVLACVWGARPARALSAPDTAIISVASSGPMTGVPRIGRSERSLLCSGR